MNKNAYLIGGGSIIAFACMLVIVESGLKILAINLVSRDNNFARSLGSGLGAIL